MKPLKTPLRDRIADWYCDHPLITITLILFALFFFSPIAVWYVLEPWWNYWVK